jgi:AraC-like DNA-binding protein
MAMDIAMAVIRVFIFIPPVGLLPMRARFA